MRAKDSGAFIAQNLEVVNRNEIASIIAIDARVLATGKEGRFVSSNLEQAYILINTWLLMIKQYTSIVTTYNMVVALKSQGLSAIIDSANRAAKMYIKYLNGDLDTSDVFDAPFSLFLEMGTLDSGLTLQLLRYPKRFTWLAAGKLADASVQKMMDINAQIFMREYTTNPTPEREISVYSGYIIQHMQEYYKRILKGFGKHFDDAIPQFSSGVCFNARTTREKLNYVANRDAYWVYPGMPLEVEDPIHISMGVVRCTAVPKSYDSYRIITPLDPICASELQRARDAWDACYIDSKYVKYFDVTDQDPNRVAALLGSCDGLYTTVDMSSASDTISRALTLELLPEDVVERISPYLERYICGRYSDGTMRIETCHMFGTSGNPITFNNEATFFLAAALTSYDIYRLLGRKCEKLMPPHIFGDDAVVDTRVYDIYVTILTSLGCKVNQDKSFSSGLYRESCGCEYFGGLDLSSKYWPRKEFASSSFKPENSKFAESVLALCSIQHRLWPHVEARTFIEAYVRDLVPDMTSSFVGEDCTDLWSSTPTFALRSAPHKGELPSEHSWSLREAHYGAVFSGNYDKGGNVDTYLYTKFLKEGPSYSDDPLCKALGLTQPRKVVANTATTLRKISK